MTIANDYYGEDEEAIREKDRLQQELHHPETTSLASDEPLQQIVTNRQPQPGDHVICTFAPAYRHFEGMVGVVRATKVVVSPSGETKMPIIGVEIIGCQCGSDLDGELRETPEGPNKRGWWFQEGELEIIT